LRALTSAALTAEIVAPGSLPGDAFDNLSSRAGVFFTKPRLEWVWEDARWADWLVAVWSEGRLAGLLPLSACRVPNWYDRLYDVSELTGDERLEPARTCLIGGRADILGSILLDFTRPADELRQVAGCAVREALNFAHKEQRRCAALYIPEAEDELSSALDGVGMAACAAPERNVIKWPEPTVDAYLGMLKRSHREVVRRDWRKRTALGLEVTAVDWETSIDAASPLINDIQLKHGQASHSELVRRRLLRWCSVVGNDGFALRGWAAGKCTGYAFGWYDRDRITMYELAFSPGSSSEVDHATYLNLMIYTPLAMCCQRNISTLDLGIYADGPKRLRGAAGERSYHWVEPGVRKEPA
jgi:hypothetical protein